MYLFNVNYLFSRLIFLIGSREDVLLERPAASVGISGAELAGPDGRLRDRHHRIRVGPGQELGGRFGLRKASCIGQRN